MKHHALCIALVSMSLSCMPAMAADASAATAVSQQQLETAIDGIAADAAKIPISGMTIAISRDGKPIFNRGYGLADIERKVPADADTVYEIGSMTKQFTAAAVLRLAEQGKLSIDDPISEYFPELATRGAGIRLRHLLNHTSGLYSGKHVENMEAERAPSMVIPLLAGRDVEFAPGERMRYNNNGYLLLGLVIEQASGQPYGEYLRDAFFKPLSLRATSTCSTPRGDKVAKAYRHDTRGDAPPAQHQQHHPSVNFSAGSICSTAGDMLAWQHALATGKAISAASHAQMTTPAPLASGKPATYGYGLYATELEGHRYIHHGGASSGFLTQMAYYPDSRLGVVVLTNGAYAGALVEHLEQDVARAARGLPPVQIANLPLPANASTHYSGIYDLGPIQIEVYAQGQGLRAQPTGQTATRLLYQGDHTFVTEHDPSVQMRFEGEGDRATSMVMSQGGRAMPPAKRKQ